MTVHMVRMCVGVDSVDQLIEIVARRTENSPEGARFITTTRFMPKRADEMIGEGSLFWIIRRAIRVRQKILDIRKFKDENGKDRCALVLSTEVVRTEPHSRRAHQGWRYLEVADAPGDLYGVAAGSGGGFEELPADLMEELKDLGLA